MGKIHTSFLLACFLALTIVSGCGGIRMMVEPPKVSVKPQNEGERIVAFRKPIKALMVSPSTTQHNQADPTHVRDALASANVFGRVFVPVGGIAGLSGNTGADHLIIVETTKPTQVGSLALQTLGVQAMTHETIVTVAIHPIAQNGTPDNNPVFFQKYRSLNTGYGKDNKIKAKALELIVADIVSAYKPATAKSVVSR